MARRRTGVRAGALVLTLVVAACGTRVDRDDRAARGAGDGLGTAPASEPSPSTAGRDPGRSGSGGRAEPAEPAGPCHPGDATGSTDTGVTDRAVTIATIQDLSGPAPGLFQAEQDAVRAFAAWCNDQGGVGGRQLRVVTKDTGFFETRQPVVEACDEAFAIVGGAAVFDDGMVDAATACGIPEVPAFSSTPQHSAAPNVVHPVPSPPNEWSAGAAYWWADQFPAAVKRAAMLYADAPTTKNRALMQQEAFEQAGFEFVYVSQIPLVELNWGPYVEEIRSLDVGYVMVWADLTAPAKLVKELAAQGVEVEIVDAGAQAYDPDYVAQAGAAAEGSYVSVASWPFEEAGENPEMQRYLEWLERTVPGGKPTALGVYAWSAALLFATGLDALGDDVTREGLLRELQRVHEWDGNGIHAPTDPGRNLSSRCFVLLQVRDGEFRRAFPDEGYDCAERNAAQVDDPSQ